MKVGIVSDTHLGYKRFERDAYLQACEAMEKASSLSDIILCPGDIFDSRIPKLETIKQALEVFSIPKRRNVPVLAIAGTHERRSRELSNPVEILEIVGLLENVHNKTKTFAKRGEKISISGMQGVPEDLTQEALKLLSVKPLEDHFNIFMFHQTIKELTPVNLEGVMSLEDLPKGFDLYVCGHYHKYQKFKVHDKKELLIPGSTVLTQLKEEEQGKKGFLVYDTLTGEHSFEKINSRTFLFKSIEFSDATLLEVKQKIQEIISEISSEKAAVKIVLRGTLKQGETLSLSEIENFQRDDNLYLEIENRLEKEEISKKIEELHELRSGKKENIMYLVIKSIVEKNQLEQKISWRTLLDIFSEEEKTEEYIKEILELD